MKIILCVPSLEPEAGGLARSVPQLSSAIADMGHEVALWSPSVTSGEFPDGCSSKEVSCYSGSFADAVEQFGEPNIVHDNGLWQPCHREVAVVCEKRNILLIVATRGMLEPWALNHKKWKKKLAWFLYQKKILTSASGLHTTSVAEKSNLMKLGLNEPIGVIPNGVGLPSSLVVAGGKIECDLKKAVFLSRVQKVKGLPLLVEAWKKVMPKGWQMEVIGPDEDGHREELLRLVKRAGLEGSWKIEGGVEGAEKWSRIADADLFILPSHSENFGIVVAEALACGVPVLTTKGAPWEGLVDYDCGWWADVTADSIALALEDATGRSDEERRAMGQRGKEWVQESFAWEGIAKAAVNFFEECITRKKREMK